MRIRREDDAEIRGFGRDHRGHALKERGRGGTPLDHALPVRQGMSSGRSTHHEGSAFGMCRYQWSPDRPTLRTEGLRLCRLSH